MSTRDDDMLLEHVKRTAEGIIEEVEARDLLREHMGETFADIDPEPGTDRIGDDVRCSIDAARDLLQLGPVDDDVDVADGLDDLPGLFDDALEVRRIGHDTGQGWEVDSVQVCVGLGGPNIYVTIEPGGIPDANVWVDGYWGGSKVERYYISHDAASSACYAAVDYLLEDDPA